MDGNKAKHRLRPLAVTNVATMIAFSKSPNWALLYRCPQAEATARQTEPTCGSRTPGDSLTVLGTTAPMSPFTGRSGRAPTGSSSNPGPLSYLGKQRMLTSSRQSAPTTGKPDPEPWFVKVLFGVLLTVLIFTE